MRSWLTWAPAAVLGLALTPAGPALAQRPRMSAEERIQASLKETKEKLALTDEQAAKIEAILNERKKQADEDRAKAAGDRQTMMTLSQERNKKYDSQIDAVLTPDQKTKMDQIREERRKRMQEPRGGPPPLPGQ